MSQETLELLVFLCVTAYHAAAASTAKVAASSRVLFIIGFEN
jgi:hypothetical protein